MSTQTTPLLMQIYEDWHTEESQLDQCLEELRAWMNEVSQLGIPHFGETATRLRPLHDRLVHHFGHEYEMIVQLAETHSVPSPELDAVRQLAAKDHQQLLVRLHDLITRLNEPDPPFESWQAAIDEVNLFVVALEQHETQESDHIASLMPT